MIPNTSPKGRAYGIHGPNSSRTVSELVETITIEGTDETYNEAIDEIKTKLRNWLDDPSGIAEYTGVDHYCPGEDSIVDGAFYDFIAEALKAADVISFQDQRPQEGSDAGLIEALGDVYDGEDGWKWDEVFDLAIDHLNDDAAFYDEPHTYTYEQSVTLDDGTEEQVKLMVSPLGGAQLLWVMDSPYITPCASCSPCIPGAGDNDSPQGFFDPRDERPGAYDPANGKYAHCLPPKWFADNDEDTPYEVVYHYQAAYDDVARQDFLTQVYPRDADGAMTKLFYGEAFLR